MIGLIKSTSTNVLRAFFSVLILWTTHCSISLAQSVDQLNSGPICEDVSVQFVYQGGCPSQSLMWFLDGDTNGSISPAGINMVNVTWTSPTTHTSVVAYCTSNSTLTGATSWLTVNGANSVGQVSTPSGISTRCQGSGNDNFTASASDAISYSWSITPSDAGTISAYGMVTWNASFHGNATVQVTALGCGDSYTTNTKEISVTQRLPVYVTISDPGPICGNDLGGITFNVIDLSNSGSNPTYKWLRGPLGTTDGNDNESSTPGTYDPFYPLQAGEKISCIVNPNGHCAIESPSNTVTIQVITPATPMVSINVLNQTMCQGSPSPTFTAVSPQNIVWYAWSIGESVTMATTPTFTPNPEDLHAPGEYIHLTVGVSGNCVGNGNPTHTLYETIYPPSDIGSLSANNTNFCSSGSVTLSLTDHVGELTWKSRYKNGENGSWSSWLPFSSSQQNSVLYNVSTESGVRRYYQFQTLAISGTCEPALSNIQEIIVYPPSSLGTLTAANGNHFCSSATVNLSLSAYVGDLAWQSRYRDGAGTTSNWETFSTIESTSNSFNIASNGSVERYYDFRVIAQSGNCAQIEGNPLSNVIVYPYPSVGNLNISPGTEFYGSIPQLTLSVSNPLGAISYESFTNGTWSAASNPLTISQDTQLRATATSGVCPIAYSLTTVTIKIYPTPLIVSTEPPYLSYGNTIHLSTGSYYLYQWTKNGISIPGATQQVLATNEPGIYVVKVKGSATAPLKNSDEFEIHDAVSSQSDQNYISAITLLKDSVNTSALHTLTPADFSQSTTYFDGLGRAMQNVITMGSPKKKDIVQPIVYDSIGRENKKYLPFVADENTGRYKDNDNIIDAITGDYIGIAQNFYNDPVAKIADDQDKPFSKTIFETSPLNRILKQGAPGSPWQPNDNPLNMDDNTVKSQYQTNISDEVLSFIYDHTTGLVSLSSSAAEKFYGPNQLYANKTYDEASNEVIEYTDKEGRTVCKKVQYEGTRVSKKYASTYYIYDDFGNLVLVLPPEAVKSFTQN